MSGENLALLRRMVAAFNARDLDLLLECFHPQIALRSAFAIGAVFRGHEGLRDWHREIDDAWSDVRLDPQRYFEREDDVLAVYEMAGRGRLSGAQVAMAVAHATRFRDGAIVEVITYVDVERALSEAGIDATQLSAFPPAN